MSTLMLQAGCASGDCYPDGLHMEDVWPEGNAGAFVYLAELYRDRHHACAVIDTDRCDIDCTGSVDPDDLSEADFGVYDDLSSIKWSVGAEFVGFKATICRRDAYVHQAFSQTGQAAWVGRSKGLRFVAKDRQQAMARIAVAVSEAADLAAAVR